MPSHNPNQVISDVKRIAESEQQSEIRLNANGGNSILVVCEPLEELAFIQCIDKLLDTDKFEVIDLNRLLLEFIDGNRAQIEQMFDLLRGSVNQIFKAPSTETSGDFFSKIIDSIASALSKSKIPVLINTGVLYGAGIDNIQIIENEVVMKAGKPTVILYPATHENDRLNFLGKRPASRYRCMIIP